MSLSVPIHIAFMETFFKECQRALKRPPTLLRDIILYIPQEVEYDGFVDTTTNRMHQKNTLSEHMDGVEHPGQLAAAQRTRQTLHDTRLGLRDAKSWASAFRTAAADVCVVHQLRTDLRWFTVRKFAVFYLENSDLTNTIRPRAAHPLDMTLDEIIAEKDNRCRREIDLLKGHFLSIDHAAQDWDYIALRGFVTQFNEEEETSSSSDSPPPRPPALEQEQEQVENEETSDEEVDDDHESFRPEHGQQYEDEEAAFNSWLADREAQGLSAPRQFVDSPLFNSIMQDRREGEHPYYITPRPTAKDFLKEIQSIIDEDVKDLIPEGIYLRLANKMKEAFNRS